MAVCPCGVIALPTRGGATKAQRKDDGATSTVAAPPRPTKKEKHTPATARAARATQHAAAAHPAASGTAYGVTLAGLHGACYNELTSAPSS